MKASTIIAGILLVTILIAAITLYVVIAVVAYQCLISDDLAVRALGAITALLFLNTIDIATKRLKT